MVKPTELFCLNIAAEKVKISPVATENQESDKILTIPKCCVKLVA